MSPATPARSSRRSLALPKWLTRPVRAVVAVLLLGLLALWYAAESDFAAERVRRLLVTRAEALLGVPVSIARLELDLLPPRLLAVDVQAAGLAQVDRLLVEIDPLGVLRNRLTLANVELYGPRVRLDLQGLGAGGGSSAVPALQLELRRLLVQDGELRFGDATTRVQGELLGVTTRMAPAGGSLPGLDDGTSVGDLTVASGNLQLRQRDGLAYEFAPIELRARYALTGRTLRVDDLHLVAGTSSVDVTGSVRGAQTADLQVVADLAVADVFKLWVPPGPADHEGRASFRGSLQLRDGSPVLSGHIETARAVVAGLRLDSLAAGLELHREAVSLRSFRAALYGGELAGELYVDRRQQPERVRVDYQATGLDASTLTRWPVLQGWRLAGTLQGQGNIAWSQPFAATAEGEGRLQLQLGVTPPAADGMLPVATAESHAAASGETHRVPALPIPAAVTFDYRVDGGTLQVQQAEVRVRGAAVTASGSVDLDGAVAMDVRLEGNDLALVDHLVAQYRAFREGRPSSRRLGLSGAGLADLQVGGTLRELQVAGAVRGSNLAVDDLQLGAVTGTLRTQGRALLAEDLLLRRGDGSASGVASLRLPGGNPAPGLTDYDVRLRLQDYAVDAQAGLGGLPYDVRAAAVRGPFRIRGNWPTTPTLEFDIEAGEARVGAAQLARLQLRGRRSEDAWLLDEFGITGLGGRLHGSGLWGISDSRLLLDATADALDVAQVCRVLECGGDLRGRLHARAQLDGRLQELAGDVRADWSEAVALDVPLGHVVGAARGDAGIFAVRLLGSRGDETLQPPDVPRTTAPGTAPTLLAEPPGGWSAALTVATRAPWPAAVRGRAGAAMVVGLLAGLGHSLPAGLMVNGQLDLQASGDLWDWQGWQGEATLAGLRLQRPPAALITAERVEALLRDGALRTVATLRTSEGALDVDVTMTTASGALDGRLDGRLDLSALGLWIEDLAASGSAVAAVRVGGTVRDPRFEGSGTLSDIAIDGGWMYPLTEASAEVMLLGDAARLENASGLLGGRRFDVSGSIPLAALRADTAATAELRMQMDDLDVMPLIARSEALGRLISAGAISGTLHLRGSGSDWRAWTGDIDVASLLLRLRDYRLDLAQPVRVQLRDGALEIPAGTLLTDARTRLEILGRVELAPLTLDLQARGRLGFEPLNVLSARWGAGGVADLDLTIRGEAGDLAWHGAASVREAVISPPVLRQPIDDISAQVTFADRRIRIDDGEGQLGGGKVTLGGEVFLRENAVQSFRLAAAVSGALLRLERDVQIRVSADVVHDGTPLRSLVSGNVTLEEGLYRRELRAESALLELLEAPESDPDPFLQSVDLSLRLRGDGDLIIDNNLANVEITADLEVRGTAAKPVLLGRSVVRGGRLFWNGNTFDVLQGTVEYNNPFETDPVFDIRARTEIRRYTIDLTFNGSLQRGVRFNYTSTPSLSELDLFNLLAFNEEPGSAVLEDPTAYQRALGLQATRYLTDAYLSEVERGAARLFGIDRFRIAPTLSGSETDATARMTVGKRVNRNLYVTYSRLLNTSEDQLLIVEYQLSPSIRVKGTREEDGSFGIDFFVQKRIR